jgi:hypothetical protein
VLHYGYNKALPPNLRRNLAPNFPIGTTYRQINGKYYIFEDDELITEEDPKGDQKIDRNGNLLGGVFISISCVR